MDLDTHQCELDCQNKSVRKKCTDCHKLYYKEYRRLKRLEKAEKLKFTRSTVKLRKSKYSFVSCERCKNKRFTDYCDECKRQVHVEKNKCYKKRNKEIATAEHKQKNTGGNNEKRPQGETKKQSYNSYAHIRCSKCEGKSFKDSCIECKKNVKRKIDADYRHRQRLKKEHAKKKVNIQSNISQLNNEVKNKNDCMSEKSNHIISENNNASVTPNEKDYTDKTYRNNLYKMKKALGSPNKTRKTLQFNKINMIVPALSNVGDSAPTADTLSEFVYDLNKESPKSFDAYQKISKLQGKIPVRTVRAVKKSLHLGFKKAKKFKENEHITRKKKKNTLSPFVKSEVMKFYQREDIVFIDPSSKYRFMSYCFKQAHSMFMEEISVKYKISLSSFIKLKPKNIKTIAQTPHHTCQCIYCENVLLKIKALAIPGISSQYALYDYLICKKPEGKKFRNVKCIYKKCLKCKDWKASLYRLASENGLDLDMNITWRKWENSRFETESGKICNKKDIKEKTGTKAQCLEELLIHDIIKPNRGFTFILHFFSQSYQTKMFNECKKVITDNEVIFVQDFAQNIELKHQGQIKGAHWNLKQITVHPTVAFVKVPGEIKPKKYIIVHLSDIKEHGASMVHYITTDCIKYLKEKLKIKLSTIYLWSDGCAAQYKGKNSFFFS